MDWDEGWIRTEQSVPMRRDVPAAQARVEAQRVATVKAQAAALRIAMRLPVNSDQRLESYEALKVHVRGIVAGGQDRVRRGSRPTTTASPCWCPSTA